MQNANRVAKHGIPPDSGGLGRLRLGRRQVWKDVTLWPLVDPAVAPDGELWPLAEALEDGFVGLGTGGGAGRVRVASRAPAPVWVPAGEPVGAWGVAAASAWIPPRSSAVVRIVAAEGCRRCSRAFARAFRPVDGQVGFVLDLHDRSLGLELVLPAGPLARRLEARLAAWAPWLLGAEDGGDPPDGFPAPEELLEAALAGEAARAGARAEIVTPRRTAPLPLRP